MENNKLIIPELNTEAIESMIFMIRGQKVILDFELAKIYGYTTKAFNQQVKNNINKFPERYRFSITKEELNIIARSKKLTAQIWATNNGGRTSLPYAFTEQGINILTTILKPKTEIHYRNVEFFNNYFRHLNNIENRENPHNKAINYEIVKFENGNISLDVRVSPNEETIWLTQNEIAELFDVTKQNVSLHIINIFEEKEQNENSVVKENLTTGLDEKNIKSNNK